MSAAIEACALAFAFDGGRAVLGPLDWTVPEGAFSLLVGATGSGKTTLLRQACPLLLPPGRREGSLRVFGADPRSFGAREAAATVGYVAQDPEAQAVCATVRHELCFTLENLGTPPQAMARRVAETVGFLGIERWLDLPLEELSGGQRQLVELASSLAARPRILLLDEPTAMLDPVAAGSFLHGLFRMNRELGLTVVVATHAPETMAAYATEAWVLEDGRTHRRDVSGFAPEPLVVTQNPPAHRGAKSPVEEASCAETFTKARPGRSSRSAPVQVSDAWVRYGRGCPWVLRGLDLAAAEGSLTVLLGGNGSGKTTLLKAVAGTLRADRGRIRNASAHRQAFLPQSPKALLSCDSVGEELREWQKSLGYGEEDVAAMLARCGLAGREDAHPYDLSGGQQQLLALGKLLLARPSLLLLDEPLKGLDGKSKATAAALVDEARAGGCTIIASSHDLAWAALSADVVALLFDGRVAVAEPPEAFFEANAFYRPVRSEFTRLYKRGRL